MAARARWCTSSARRAVFCCSGLACRRSQLGLVCGCARVFAPRCALTMSASGGRAAKRALDQAVSQTRAALRKARRTVAAADAATRRQWVLVGDVFNAVVLMCWQAGGDTAPAVKYLQGVARQRGWPKSDDAAIAALVTECVVGADMDCLLELTDESTPVGASAARVAARYVQEWALYTWACQLNVGPGVAPRTKAVLAECEAHRSRCAGGAQPPPRGNVTSATARMWASRWRQRWGGGYGRLRVRDQPPLEEMRAKACVFFAAFPCPDAAPPPSTPTPRNPSGPHPCSA